MVPGAGKGVEVESDEKEKKEAADLRKSNAYLIFNFLLTVGVIALLSTGIGKSYVIFMLVSASFWLSTTRTRRLRTS